MASYTDGSAKLFVDLINEAEPVDLSVDRKFLNSEPLGEFRKPFADCITHDGLKITCTGGRQVLFNISQLI